MVHPVKSCSVCGDSLAAQAVKRFESRQVFDIPPLKIEVTEHRCEVKDCLNCGHESSAEFPKNVSSPTQYGPNIQVLSVYMSPYQFIPVDRLGIFYEDVFGHRISDGTILRASKKCFASLKDFEIWVKKELAEAPVVHFDETGHYVKGHRQWLHSSSTKELTL